MDDKLRCISISQSESPILHLDILPREIWLIIFSFLDGQSLATLINSHEKVAELLSEDIFWFKKCKAALSSVPAYPKIKIYREKTKTSWKDLYLNQISPYGYLLGYWQKYSKDPNEFRGNILKFSILPDLGLMYGYVSKPISGDHQFDSCVVIHSDGELSSNSAVETYPFGVENHEVLSDPVYTCSESRPADEHSQYMHHVYSQEIIDFAGLTTRLPSKEEEEISRWIKLRSLSSYSEHIIQPGIFKSLYGGHGWENIHVFTLESEKKIVGSKIHGDPNVPVGKHTFVIDLLKPLNLSLSNQETLEQLVTLTDNLNPGENLSNPQPFVLPDDVNTDDEELLPDRCLARYVGQATLAYDRYTNPWWSDVHWVLFSQDLFAIVFLELKWISLYKRQKNIVF